MRRRGAFAVAFVAASSALEAALGPLQVVSLARPPESRLLSGTLDEAAVATWKWKEATMGDGAGARCTGAERALAERVSASVGGGEAMVVSTCARLDVYACSSASELPLADVVAADVGALATSWRGGRLFAPRYAGPVDLLPELVARSGAGAARHVVEVAVFAGKERCEFDPFDSHQAHVLKQLKAAFDDAQKGGRDATVCGPRLSALLRTALEAGKLARDSRSCRALGKLRGLAATGVELAEARLAVAGVVDADVVDPAVAKAAAAWAALDAGPAIRRLSALADAAANDALAVVPAGDARAAAEAAARKAAKRVLHEPLTALRAGGLPPDDDRILADVRRAVGAALGGLT